MVGGDSAILIASGMVCGSCGVIIDGTEPGFRRWCERCAGVLARKRQQRNRHAAKAPIPDDDPEDDDLIADDPELEDVCDG
jgi:hypothetical protein